MEDHLVAMLSQQDQVEVTPRIAVPPNRPLWLVRAAGPYGTARCLQLKRQ